MQEDSLLIRRAQKGNADAFEALLTPHEGKIYALCLRTLGNREDAMDCAQEAMLRIWRAIKTYKGEAAFTTWAYRIAANTCLDLLRKQKTRPSVSLDLLTESGFAPEGSEGDPHEHVEKVARKEALSEGILALPEDMRMPLVLRDVQGFSYDEVAGILDLPLGTVKSRINRAREKLRGELAHHGELFRARRVYTGEGGKKNDM